MTRLRHSSWHGGTGCVIFYLLPWMGLELLDTAWAVAEFDLPGRVLGLCWGNIIREDMAGAAARSKAFDGSFHPGIRADACRRG